MSDLSSARDLVRWQVEHKAKEPFLKPFKGDVNNMQLSVDYSVWNSLENIEKAAYSFHSEIKNFWKWVKKGLVALNADESSLKQQLLNVTYFFTSGNLVELDKWKTSLIAGNTYHYPLCF